MELERVIHDFQPIYNSKSRILMLGTMPSPKSREVGFYYGHLETVSGGWFRMCAGKRSR